MYLIVSMYFYKKSFKLLKKIVDTVKYTPDLFGSNLNSESCCISSSMSLSFPQYMVNFNIEK